MAPRSVIAQPHANGSGPALGFDLSSVVLSFASAADTMPAWGTAPGMRDQMLRAFWPTEDILASALFTTVSKYAAFGWTLDGPPRTVKAYQDLLHGADQGAPRGKGCREGVSRELALAILPCTRSVPTCRRPNRRATHGITLDLTMYSGSQAGTRLRCAVVTVRVVAVEICSLQRGNM